MNKKIVFKKEIERDEETNFHRVECENLNDESLVRELEESGFEVKELESCYALLVFDCAPPAQFKKEKVQLYYQDEDDAECETAYSIKRGLFDDLKCDTKAFFNPIFKDHVNFKMPYRYKIISEFQKEHGHRIIFQGLTRPLGDDEYLLQGKFLKIEKKYLGRIYLAYKSIDAQGNFNWSAKFYRIVGDELHWVYASTNSQLIVDNDYQLKVNEI